MKLHKCRFDTKKYPCNTKKENRTKVRYRTNTKDRTMLIFREYHREGEAGTRRCGGTRPPLGPTGTWVQAKGGKGGGARRHGNGGRRRHAAQSAGMSGRSWRVAGACDNQVGGALYRERRRGAGGMRGLWLWTTADGDAVGKRGGNELSRNERRKRCGGKLVKL